MRTFKLYTFGCKVNQYETQEIREQFERVGFNEGDNGVPANIYLINTCTVTNRADSESLNSIRRVLRENPKAKVIATGCLAELDSQRIKNISRKILIFKNNDKKDIVNNLSNHLCSKHGIVRARRVFVARMNLMVASRARTSVGLPL